MIRKLLIKTLRYSGLPFLFREVFQRNKVTILMWHDIAPAAAEAVFSFIARHYKVISLQDYLDARQSGKALPKKAAIITLDDGHIRNYTLLPLLKKLNLPVTIFLCTGIIDTNRHYWFKFKRPSVATQAMKKVPNREKLARLAELGFWPEREFDTPQALTRAQITEMKHLVDFQSHTVFHPCLPTCDDQEARLEIFQSKQHLEDQYGIHVRALAYPNGDYSDRDIQLLKEAGYECAITVDYGFNSLRTDPYRLKRLSVDDVDNVDAVCVKASGVWTLLLHFLGKRRLHGWSREHVTARPPAISQPTAAFVLAQLHGSLAFCLDNLIIPEC